MKTYVYYMDMFKLIDMDTDKMLELAERSIRDIQFYQGDP
jgi:hypothetical protein